MMDRAAFLFQSGFGRRRDPVQASAKNDWNTVATAASTSFLAPSLPTNSILLACSAAEMSQEHREIFGMRRLGEDRKGFFDHLKFGPFTKNMVRVTMMQGTTVYSTYLSDQLREDMKRDEQVNEGKLSRSEADHQADEWSQKEWPKRWEILPKKLLMAYARYHAITLVMRAYESLAARMLDEVMVDKLTLDTYSSSLRRQKSGEKMSLRETTTECWYSNLIAYLADYSVHQMIMAFGYVVYIREQQRKRKLKKDGEEGEAAGEIHPGSVVLSFTRKSASLAFTRAIGLWFASIGGAIGSSFVPGWGTLVGINMGDGLAITVTDELVSV